MILQVVPFIAFLYNYVMILQYVAQIDSSVKKAHETERA